MHCHSPLPLDIFLLLRRGTCEIGNSHLISSRQNDFISAPLGNESTRPLRLVINRDFYISQECIIARGGKRGERTTLKRHILCKQSGQGRIGWPWPHGRPPNIPPAPICFSNALGTVALATFRRWLFNLPDFSHRSHLKSDMVTDFLRNRPEKLLVSLLSTLRE